MSNRARALNEIAQICLTNAEPAQDTVRNVRRGHDKFDDTSETRASRSCRHPGAFRQCHPHLGDGGVYPWLPANFFPMSGKRLACSPCFDCPSPDCGPRAARYQTVSEVEFGVAMVSNNVRMLAAKRSCVPDAMILLHPAAER